MNQIIADILENLSEKEIFYMPTRGSHMYLENLSEKENFYMPARKSHMYLEFFVTIHRILSRLLYYFFIFYCASQSESFDCGLSLESIIEGPISYSG